MARACATLVALWFGFVAAEPVLGMHRCPMHDGTIVASPHASHHAASQKGAPARDTATHHCTCLDCAAPGAHALPAVGVAAPRGVFVDRQPVVAPAPPVPTTRFDHLLPFSNGPPCSVIAA
jgi:hypothetical protein